MKKGMPKVVIADAERHRRTPRLSAISEKAIDVWAAGFCWGYGRFNARRWQKLATLVLE